LITAKDHASVQINIGEVDASGRYTGSFTTYALSGFVRKESEADDSINRLATKDGRKYLHQTIGEQCLFRVLTYLLYFSP
jgi:hypothetical protein